MKTTTRVCVCMMILGLLLSLNPDLLAEEPSVEIIDKTNWQKVEGLVPDCLLEWVKAGEWTLPVGELDYDLYGMWPDFVVESRTANIGKYALDETGAMVEAETGKSPTSLVGFPFPKVDPEDPQAGAKIMYNKLLATNCMGNKRFNTVVTWIGRTGFEREIKITFLEAILVGCPQSQKYKNPKEFEKYSLLTVKSPYDLAGTSMMLWRYLSAKQDVNFAYVPAIRRVRRTTPANRSDGFVGSDLIQDDAAAYDGKMPAFEWKFVGKREGLLNFAIAHPDPMSINKKEEWMMEPTTFDLRYGYEDEGWQGSVWCPFQSVYVKRPVWVVEGMPKDPYYNSGVQYIWVDSETYLPLFKITHDRAGNFWKFLMPTMVGHQTGDKKEGCTMIYDHIIVDTRRDHGTRIKQWIPGNTFYLFSDLDMNDFTLAGFQKYCK